MLYYGDLDDLIQIHFEMDETASESREAISYTLKRTKVTRNEIQFQFYFTKPLEIVPKDKINIKVNFN